MNNPRYTAARLALAHLAEASARNTYDTGFGLAKFDRRKDKEINELFDAMLGELVESLKEGGAA